MTRDNFICKVVSELLDDGFNILLVQEQKVKECGGYFDYDNKEFVVALKNKLGFEILLHEYSHYIQWKERRKYFNNLIMNCGIVFDWVDGTFFKKDVLDYSFGEVIELEWDCEKQVIDLIKKYKLDVDIKEYCKAANSYLLFYHIVREHRKWYKTAPYNSSLIDSMPDKIMDLEWYLDKDNITDKQYKKYLKLI